MTIKVLGSGCANCKKLLDNVKMSVSNLNMDVEVLYLTSYKDIMEAGLLRTPGLLIDDKIISSGKVLSIDEISNILSTYNQSL